MTTAALRRLAAGPARHRRTVRLHLTVLYGALFLVSGVAVLTITYLLVRHNTGHFVVFKVGPPAGAPEPSGPPLPDIDTMRAQAGEQRSRMLSQLLTQSAVALAIMSVVSVGLGWVMAGRALRPMEQAFAAQRRFVANASHELRTPLAMMRTSVDVATGKPKPAPQVVALGHKVREGLDQADRLLESFLTLARAQNGSVTEREPVALAPLVASAAEWLHDAVVEGDIRIEQDVGDMTVEGNRTLLARLVGNLMDNAIRHNEPGGWARVTATRHHDSVELVIENGGAHMAHGDVAALAEPFRRLGADRVGSANGHGLGLSIVAAVAAAHGGTLRLDARDGGGMRATVTLPGRAA